MPPKEWKVSIKNWYVTKFLYQATEKSLENGWASKVFTKAVSIWFRCYLTTQTSCSNLFSVRQSFILYFICFTVADSAHVKAKLRQQQLSLVLHKSVASCFCACNFFKAAFEFFGVLLASLTFRMLRVYTNLVCAANKTVSISTLMVWILKSIWKLEGFVWFSQAKILFSLTN